MIWSAAGILGATALVLIVQTRLARSVVVAELDGLRLRNAQLVAEVADAEQHVAATRAAHESVTVGQPDAPSKKAPPPPPQNRRIVETLPPSLIARREAMANDPRAQSQQLSTMRTQYIETYCALVEQLGLTEARAARLVDNLLRRYEQQIDLGYALQKQPPGSFTTATIDGMRDEIDAELRAAQLALLGEDGYRRFEDYQRTLPLRRFVDNLAGTAALGGAPITGAQADALIAAMADASPRLRAGGTLSLSGTEDLEWDKVFATAGGILDEAQITVLKTAAIPIWNKARLEELARKAK